MKRNQPHSKPLSLAPMSAEEALRRAMNTPPPPNPPKAKKKKPRLRLLKKSKPADSGEPR